MAADADVRLVALIEKSKTSNSLRITGIDIPITTIFPSNITMLWIEHIPTLTELPPLPSRLKIFAITDTGIEKLPPLPRTLIELECTNNKIKDSGLPDELPQRLELFNCEGNKLTKIKNILPDRIVSFFCSNNNLTELPFIPISIREIECNHNLITTIQSFASYPYLHNLDISYNRITRLPKINPAILTDFKYIGNPVPEYTRVDTSLPAIVSVEINPTTQLQIPESVVDVIMASEEKTSDYVAEDKDNLVFVLGKSASGYTRDALIRYYNDRSLIAYECTARKGLMVTVQDVVMDKPLIKLQLSFGNILVPVTDILPLLGSKHQYWVLEKTRNIAFSAGRTAIGNGVLNIDGAELNLVGVDHCSDGTDKTVYSLKPVSPAPAPAGGKRSRRKTRRSNTKRRKTRRIY